MCALRLDPERGALHVDLTHTAGEKAGSDIRPVLGSKFMYTGVCICIN